MKDKDKNFDKLSENDFDNNPPTEFIDGKSRRNKTTPSKETNKYADLEKFKKGELGVSHIGYNDDGSPQKGASQKLDIDTKTDLKQ